MSTVAAAGPIPAPRYFGGTLLAQARAAGVTVSQVRYDRRGRCRRHTHGAAFMALVLRGGYREEFGRSAMSIRASEMGFHPEGTEHADEVVADGTTFVIVETERDWVGASCLAGRGPQLMTPHACGLAAGLLRATRAGDGRTPLVLESLAAELGADLAATTGPPMSGTAPAWVARVRELLESEFARRLTLDAVARAVDLHPVYVSRAFRRRNGEGLPETLRAIRVRRALAEVCAGATIADAAVACGFADQSQLTKAVKKVTGLTPGIWKRLADCASSSVDAPGSPSYNVIVRPSRND